MRVKCLLTDISGQPFADDERVWRQSDDGLLDLSLGREYVVYATETMYGMDWFYVLPQGQDVPLSFPAAVFSIVDGSIPPGWCYQIRQAEDGQSRSLLSYTAWAGDKTYYERLLDRDASALQAFQLERINLAVDEQREKQSTSNRSKFLKKLDWGNQDLFLFSDRIILLESDELVSSLNSIDPIESIVFLQGDPWIEYADGCRKRFRIDAMGGIELMEF
jgi:hypothetical protein